jgi:hypothetical protein
MKTLKPMYTEKSLKHERVVVFTLLIIIGAILLFGSAVSAKVTSLKPIHTALIVETKDNTAILKWSYSADIQYTYFLVERSQDGVHYSFVSAVKIDGPVNSTNIYTATDYNPLQGTTYYRVSETNFQDHPTILFRTMFSTNPALTQN